MTVPTAGCGAGSEASRVESDFFFADIPGDRSSEEFFRTRAVIDAIVKNRLRELSIILSMGPISSEDRGWAVIVASAREDSDALRILLSTPERERALIAGQHRGVALIATFEKKCYSAMSLLLADVSAVSRESLRLILRLAAHRGDCKALEILLASGAFEEGDYGEAAIVACDAGKVNVVRFFLQKVSIAKRDLEKARKRAEANEEITRLIDEVIGPPSSCAIM